MTVSRVSYDPTKNYQEIQFNQDVSLLDSELNELQKIIRGNIEEMRRVMVGAACAGDEWRVVANSNVNSITVKAGTFFHFGAILENHQDTTVAFLSTPTLNRTDVVFVEYYQTLVDSTQDPNILDPQVGMETTQRFQMVYNIRVAEGSTVPTPTAGRNYFRIATLQRQAGNPSITEAMISDDRTHTMQTYMVRGCAVVPVSGLTVQVQTGQVKVANLDYYVQAGFPATVLPANQTSYIIMDGPQPSVVSSLPHTYHTPLAQITTDATSVVSLVDLRVPQPLVFLGGAGGGNNTPTPPVDNPEQTTGVYSSYMVGENIGQYQVVYLSPTIVNLALKADNSSSATAPAVGLALTAVANGQLGTFMKMGQIQNAGWNWTLGKPIYLGTGGNMTQTPPTADNTIIQELAYPVAPDTLEFMPNLKTIRN